MFRSNLAELEAGFQVIASSHKRDRWHLLPCLTLLVLAVLFMHPGRVKALRAEFDGPPCVCRRRTASLGRMPGLGWYLRAVPRERRAPSGGFGPGHCIARETRLEACLQGPDCSVV